MGAWWLTATGALITGFCYGLQSYLNYKGYQLPKRLAYYNDGAAFYFKALFLILFIRSFVVEWAIAPSEALKPTLLMSDRIITDKAAYGIRLPITGHLLIPFSNPKRGDVLVFRSPLDSSKGLVNRLIGLPGDTIEYQNKKLILNGKQVSQIELGIVYDEEKEGSKPWLIYEEDLEGFKHPVYLDYHSKKETENKPIKITVPLHHYFVMGDHRDESIDSRFFGCISERHLLGKARRVYLSWGKPTAWWKLHLWIHWDRLWMKIK